MAWSFLFILLARFQFDGGQRLCDRMLEWKMKNFSTSYYKISHISFFIKNDIFQKSSLYNEI